MKAIQNVVTLLGLMFFSGLVLASSATAQLAKEAYFIIERNPLDTDPDPILGPPRIGRIRLQLLLLSS